MKKKDEKKDQQKQNNKPKPKPKLPEISKTGTFDINEVYSQLKNISDQDRQNTFRINQPASQTDAFGNARNIIQNPDGTISIQDQEGDLARSFREKAMAASGMYNSEDARKRAEEASFATLTKYHDRDRLRDMEEAKQEMADRGIAYDPAATFDPNTKDLYGRTIGGINERYGQLKQDAANQSILAGNQAFATSEDAKNAFFNNMMTGVQQYGAKFAPFQNNQQIDNAGLYGGLLNAQIDTNLKTHLTKLAQRATGGGFNRNNGRNTTSGFEIIG